MAKIVAASDIHLDSPFSDLPNDEGKLRRESLRNIFSKIIDVANEERADVLLLPGDIFDGYPIRPETADSFIRDLQRAKMPVFITPGNHDPYTSDSPYQTLSFPDNVHIFITGTLTAVELADKGLRIFGSAYLSDRSDERILSDFSVPNDNFTNILLLHSDFNCTDKYSPISTDELAASGADFAAIGHIHIPTPVQKAGNTYYAYCGCPEARHFGEAHDTGIYVGEILKGNVNLTYRRISDYRYREETINAEEHPDVISVLPSPAKYEFLRLTLTGETDAILPEELKEKLLTNYADVTIYDKTTLPRDIWEGISDEGLRGVFLRKMKAMLDMCEDETEKKKLLLATKLGINAIENREI